MVLFVPVLRFPEHGAAFRNRRLPGSSSPNLPGVSFQVRAPDEGIRIRCSGREHALLRVPFCPAFADEEIAKIVTSEVVPVPENLLLDAYGNLKVSNFGLSALSQQVRDDGLLHTTCGTPNYVAPEVLNDRGYDGATADLWSCGVILFVLLAGYLPFEDSNIITLYKKRTDSSTHSHKELILIFLQFEETLHFYNNSAFCKKAFVEKKVFHFCKLSFCSLKKHCISSSYLSFFL
ncbi:hypothetical protein ZIOFF_032090 [Zingiber officinale]|uniref:Protein kinase domain-containing protein n=1 Tax=Zingiber officinale TaxID=94328 RepID=A0A8J5GIJ2_ZINOF|nr:hypothetical protein ZIOFF_032090 [Zingiber officinale]